MALDPLDAITSLQIAVIGAIAGIVSGIVSALLTWWLARRDRSAVDEHAALLDLQDAIERLLTSVMDVGSHTSARLSVPAGTPVPPIDPLLYRDWVIAHARLVSLAERVTDGRVRLDALYFGIAAIAMAKTDATADELEVAQANLIKANLAVNVQLGKLIRQEVRAYATDPRSAEKSVGMDFGKCD